jgi:hypothetical protein
MYASDRRQEREYQDRHEYQDRGEPRYAPEGQYYNGPNASKAVVTQRGHEYYNPRGGYEVAVRHCANLKLD